MRFPRTQFRNPRTWPYWKCNRLFPSVELALSGPENALQWLLSQSLRYSFWKIYGDELQGLALIAQGQKITFSSLGIPLLSLVLSHILVWWHSEGIFWVFCSAPYNLLPLLQLGIWSGVCTSTQKMDVSPSDLSVRSILEACAAPLSVGLEEKGKSRKGLDSKELNINLVCHQLYTQCNAILPWW